MSAHLIVAFAAGVFAVSPCAAQIYEWRDASGSRHYTNDPEDIPEDVRNAARIVVRSEPASERVAAAAADEFAEESPRERRRRERQERIERRAARPRSAQVVYDNSFRFQRRAPAEPMAPVSPMVQEVHVNIAGPLAVSEVVVPAPQVVIAGDPYFGFLYQPAVTTSFDRGRSRHRTLRMLLQEQFQFDRDGPFVYDAGPVPLGPRFRTPLTRGVRSCSSAPRPVVRR